VIKKIEYVESNKISQRLFAQLKTFQVTGTVEQSADFRRALGAYMEIFHIIGVPPTVGTNLYACFETARMAGATIKTMDLVRTAMFAESPLHGLGHTIVNAAIIFSYVEQSHLIADTNYRSRSDIAIVLDKMIAITEDIKLNMADFFVASDYQNFIRLSALLIQHLSATERQLPRVINLTFPVHLPALTMSNRIYGDGSRSEELIAENKTVHPAFMQREVMALSQ